MASNETKITFKASRKIVGSFEAMLREAMLKRDALLAHVIAAITPELREFAKGHRNSDIARREIAKRTRSVETKLLNVVLSKSTAMDFNDAVDAGNYCRDAVLNRVILLLAPPINILDGVSHTHVGASETLQQDRRWPLAQVVDILKDPLATYRDYDAFGDDIWSWPIAGPHLSSISCYVDDVHVPGTAKYFEQEKLIAEAFGGLQAAEEKGLKA